MGEYSPNQENGEILDVSYKFDKSCGNYYLAQSPKGNITVTNKGTLDLAKGKSHNSFKNHVGIMEWLSPIWRALLKKGKLLRGNPYNYLRDVL